MYYWLWATYTKVWTILMLQARLRRLQICRISLLLFQILETLGVVHADIVPKVGGHDPNNLLAVDNSIMTSILVFLYAPACRRILTGSPELRCAV
jgi:hypothetical protein